MHFEADKKHFDSDFPQIRKCDLPYHCLPYV